MSPFENFDPETQDELTNSHPRLGGSGACRFGALLLIFIFWCVIFFDPALDKNGPMVLSRTPKWGFFFGIFFRSGFLTFGPWPPNILAPLSLPVSFGLAL